MNKFVMVATFCTAVFFSTIAESAQDAQFVYVMAGSESDNHLTREAFSIDVRKKIYYRGHAGIRMQVCGAWEDLHCFSSPAMSFAVPRRAISKGQSWTKDDRQYVISGEDELEILGLSIPVFLINSSSERGKSTFYYSNKFGLVAISIKHTGQAAPALYWSKYLCGFPMKCPTQTKRGRR